MAHEPWRDKLPPTVVEGIDRYREKLAKEAPIMTEVRLVTGPHLTFNVPPGLMYKKVRITMTLEGEK